MCGIAGVIWADDTAVEQQQRVVAQMTDAIAHRGPDGAGFWSDGRCALGHRRLSIMDLDGGAQPMLDSTNSIALTFNGEIYGFEEIRRDCNYPFKTECDTEVILALYDKYGEDLARHLPGMFSFALWDEKEQSLFCARDRFGEKPFFYAWGEHGEIVFASEIKAIIKSGLVKPKLNLQSIGHYLQKLYVHPETTIFSNVFTLPPAHILRWQNGDLRIERYWNMPVTRDKVDAVEAVERFRELLGLAVARQMRADVPVAAFLSGGLDSSSIVALAVEKQPQLQTLAFGFGENQSELGYARELAARYGTRHLELGVENHSLAELLHEMARVYDEPFADSSNVPTYLIAREARHHAKVVLSGDGGDELLAGYEFWYRALWDMEHLPQSVATLYRAIQIARKVADATGQPIGRLSRWHRAAYLKRSGQTMGQAHDEATSFFSDVELESLGVANQKTDAQKTDAQQTTLDEVLRGDLQTYLPGDILVKTDRATMAHGLELRAPFLDVEFASFCLSLPENLKMDARANKVILRSAFADAWTPSIAKRGKQGFGAPVNQWLQTPQLRELKAQTLADPNHRLYQFLPFHAVQKLSNADDYRTWALLMLALWFEHGLGKYL